jgi:hypothetical protein
MSVGGVVRGLGAPKARRKNDRNVGGVVVVSRSPPKTGYSWKNKNSHS